MEVEITYTKFNMQTQEREFSHKYKFNWSKTDLFCPKCGKSSIWSEDGSGDYYVGVAHICVDCESKWFLATGCESDTLDAEDNQILKQVKAHISQPQPKIKTG